MTPFPAPPPPSGTAVPIFCSLIPREVLQVAGLSPVEVRPPEEPDRRGLHACALCDNICSWVKHLIGRLATSEASVVVVPTGCDAMTKLHDALAAGGLRSRLFRLDVPRGSEAGAVAYLAEQYVRLLAALGVTETDCAKGTSAPAGATAGGDRPLAGPRDARTVPRIGLAGSVYPEALFCDALRGAGAQVQVLRRCGMPLPSAPPAPQGEGTDVKAFCTRLAAHYLRSAVCPRMTGSAFEEYLAGEVAARGLAALVLPVLKFCDGYHLAIDRLAARLPDGFPLLLVEGDLTAGFGEQTVTRLEAFVESLAPGNAGRSRPPHEPRLAAGVDVGSTQVKAVLIDGEGRIACTFVRPTTGLMTDASADAVAQLLQRAGVTRTAVAALGVTGYGRKGVVSDAVATEISCHALGVGSRLREPATVVDVGGQDSKVIVVDGHARVLRFTMNDKCAAGTGRFIDGMVRGLGLDFHHFSTLSLEARAEVPVTSMCSVFAESEVISLSARGEPLAGIARGINASIARRVAAMVRRVDGRPPFVLTGGVSQNAGFVHELERELGAPVVVFEHALYAGAIGAAMLALEAAS